MSKANDRMLELAGVKPLLTEAKTEPSTYMYEALADSVVDATIMFHEKSSAVKKHLENWDFGNDIKYKTATITGDKAVLTFSTPDGDKKVEVIAKLKK